MRVCFTSDLHGSETLFTQLDELLAKERPELLILGGDIFADGSPESSSKGQIAYVRDQFFPRLQRWFEDYPRLQVAILAGNHDWVPTVDLCREQQTDRLKLLEPDRPWRVQNTTFLGFGYTPWTPHTVKDYERLDMLGDPTPEAGGWVWDIATQSPREVSAEEHFKERPALAEKLAAAPEIAAPWIFVCHAPPKDTNLDRLPNLDVPIGSEAVRQFIGQRRPTISLHGHVHESPEVTGHYSEIVGDTLCVNPGQSFEKLYAVLFDLSDPKNTLRHTAFES